MAQVKNFGSMLVTAGFLFGSFTAQAAIEPGPFGATSSLLNSSPKPMATPTASTSGQGNGSTASAAKTALTFSCTDLRRTTLRMSAHASNLANRTATRTPEGGPYKRLEVVCKAAGGAFCNVEKVDESNLEYRPGHPDADPNGYVKVPAIVAGQEVAGLSSAASELKLLASQGVCGAKSLEQGQMLVVKYHPDFDVMMDTVTFGPEGNVARWSRTTRDGKTQNMAFKADGSPASL